MTLKAPRPISIVPTGSMVDKYRCRRCAVRHRKTMIDREHDLSLTK